MSDRFGVLSPDLWVMRGELADTLGADVVRVGPAAPFAGDALLAWSDGRGRATRRLGAFLRKPVRGVAEGPFRSVRPDRGQPLSFVVESAAPPERASDERARAGLATLRRLRVSWRNDGLGAWPAERGPPPRTLVVVARGIDRAALAAACRDLPGPVAFVADAREPDGVAAAMASLVPGAAAVSGLSPWALFDGAAHVVAPPGDLARLAVMAGLPVTTVGAAPALGEDPAACFAQSCLDGVTYLDPWTRRVCDFETAAGHLAFLRDRFRENGRRSVCVGVSRWKRERIAAFLDGPAGPPVFVASADAAASLAARTGGQVVAWETRMPRRLAAACREADVSLVRMEDGFLRSVGLGAAFLPGASCVLDGRGIYYDPNGPSDLEHILATAPFDADLLARAARLRADVIALRLSKYNVGRPDDALALPDGRTCLLVPGQVEDDASVMLGSPAVRGNLALLQAARAGNSDAFIVFKPHPDVEAGLRRGKVAEADALRFADRVVGSVPIVDLLDRVDGIETMTSLAGFEALIRGKRTVVHGRPFYAGWGLTTDRDPPPRRTRRLSVDELVAGALLLYPRYLDPVSGLRCPPEILVRRLAEARDAAQARPALVGRLQNAAARARHRLLGPVGLLLRRARGAVRTDARGTPDERNGGPP